MLKEESEGTMSAGQSLVRRRRRRCDDEEEEEEREEEEEERVLFGLPFVLPQGLTAYH